MILERTDPFMNSLETFTDQLIQHGTDLGAKLLSALVVLVIGLWLCRWVIRLVQHSRALDKLDPSLHTFLTSCTRIVLYVLLGLNVAGILGIQTTSFLTLLASGSVAVGLALQGALSNFAGGLMLLIFKPFKVGDYIKADGQEGTVKAVTVFYTFLTTPDNKVVTLPNGSLTGTAVVNYTANPTRLLMQTYTASYDAPVEKVKAVLLETARANPMVLADPAPMLFKVFGDSTRLRIMYTISENEMSVLNIAEALSMEQSTISHQLRVLRQNKLVRVRREGKQIYYSLDDDHVKRIIEMGLDHVLE